jgi:membrane protease YdiL (CAAX protease family)
MTQTLAKTTQLRNLLLTWGVMTVVWGIYRLAQLPELINEVFAKPALWLGIILAAYKLGLIPLQVFQDLRKKYLQHRDVLRIFLVPMLGIAFYFVLVNLPRIHWQTGSLHLLPAMILMNFMTGVVEEVVYRGIFYVWLLKIKSEIFAFCLVQLLFLLAHIPTLILRSPSTQDAIIHAFFILLLGAIHTAIFRLTKSLFASSLAHGTWNTLTQYFLIGTL